jgi:DNA-binding transcriptional MerR regulator
VTTYAPIREVAEHFGIPMSTLHYWERRGLVWPQRRGAQRVYDAEQLYRIALIQTWRQKGRMSIEEIGELLRPNDGWRAVVRAQVSDIERQIEDLHAARDYLEFLLTCQQGSELARCSFFRASVEIPVAAAR